MASKDTILNKLKAARPPFTDIAPIATRLPVTLMPDTSPAVLRQRFIMEAKKVACHIYEAATPADAVRTVLRLIGDEKRVLAWDADQMGVAGLADALTEAGIITAPARSDDVRVGLTGVNAALAATGSLLLMSGAGRPRTASLLPDVHIAVVPESRLMADLEAWFDHAHSDNLKQFRAHSNTVIITGPSKTADIAQELILGAHGPREVHVVICAGV